MKSEGVRGLYRGVPAVMLGMHPSSPPSSKFGTNKTVKAIFWPNMAHIRQSRPDSGIVFEVKVLKTLQVVPSSLVKSEGVRGLYRGVPAVMLGTL